MANTDTTAMTIDDLAFVLRLTHAQTLVSPSDIVTASSEKINSRYARELLALGTNHNLLLVEDDPELGDVWMLQDSVLNDLTDASANTGNYHGISEDIVAASLGADKPIAKPKKDKPKVKPAPAATTKGDFRKCNCGCGENVNGKSLYRPGHDARHAGWVARHIAAQPTDEREFDALNELPTQALRDKASAHAERLIAKNAKSNKQADEPTARTAPVVVHGEVKIGRWTYKVETDSSVESGAVYIKKDGTRTEVPEATYNSVSWDPAV